MANINVSYADIQGIASQLTSGKTNLEQELNRLKGLVDDLVATGFVTDKASKAFGASYEQFTTGSTQAIDGLDGLSQFLTKSAGSLQDLDSQLASSLGN